MGEQSNKYAQQTVKVDNYTKDLVLSLMTIKRKDYKRMNDLILDALEHYAEHTLTDKEKDTLKALMNND